jgi:hypothetical protein
MAVQWEVFRGGQTVRGKQQLTISINKNMVLRLNPYAREILGKPDAVLLMFDKKESVIALAPTHANDPDRFDLKSKSNGQDWVVHTAPFCRHHNITVEQTERFVKPGLTREGYLTLDLKQTVLVRRRRPERSLRKMLD